MLTVNLVNYIKRHISNSLGTEDMDPAVSYYFTDTSSSLEFVNARSVYTEASLRSRGEEDPRALIAAIKFADRGKTTSEDPENLYIAQLEQERLLLDSLIALAAANNVAPVIRMPLSNNDIYSQVSNLASVDRSNGRKVNVMMKNLRDLLAPYLDGWLEYLDSSASSAIKLVSNLPLEWAFHQGLPLMVRHEASRIPITPGYVTTQLLLDSNTVHLSLEEFREILFISSFADNDPIRNDLKAKLPFIQSLSRSDVSFENLKMQGLLPKDFDIPKDHDRFDVRIKWIDVANKKELIDAINNNPSAITVFDLHGSHSEQGAFIHLKDEKVSVFDIYQDIRVSPIIILSACDTSPVDKGHDSIAEAFFLAGAKTMISSALPIQSDLASTFLARLLERIKTYLPARVRSEGRPIRWSTFVSGMIRRTYYSELVSLLQKDLGFDSDKKMCLLFSIGIHIDPLSQNWVQAVREEIITQLKIDADYLDHFVACNVQFLECMKYLQLGRPESIIISAERKY
ncbi:MAG: CHAT domain-containing protein [Betaproteobacteria bacterium]|nr:CHAT domain-containing protein [Betaproteobacteria bacterium]